MRFAKSGIMSRETVFLSVALQKGNAVPFSGTFPYEKLVITVFYTATFQAC